LGWARATRSVDLDVNFLLIDASIKNNLVAEPDPQMQKIGMEPVRRKALIDATISAIGERGSLDVTMSEIAGRAGVSSALAHHYFGAKDELLFATMRHILTELNIDTRPDGAQYRHKARPSRCRHSA